MTACRWMVNDSLPMQEKAEITVGDSINDCLRLSQHLLEVSDSPRLDTEVLLAKALGKTRTYLYTWPESRVAPAAQQKFLAYFKRRCRGEPIAYITGEREFWSLPLAVNSDALIPRADTEIVVETALSLYADNPQQPRIVADLGTGTGAIALALAGERPHWTIYALEKFAATAGLAKNNCRRLHRQNVFIIQGDWLTALTAGFDLIVGNPPYIAAADQHLHRGDVRFEPQSALIADRQGLADIECIIAQSYPRLLVGGWLLLEHGYNQASIVMKLLRRHGFSNCFLRRDLNGKSRVSGGNKQY